MKMIEYNSKNKDTEINHYSKTCGFDLTSWEMEAAEQLMQLSESYETGRANAASISSNVTADSINDDNDHRIQRQDDGPASNNSTSGCNCDEVAGSINHEHYSTTSWNSSAILPATAAAAAKEIIRSNTEEVNSKSVSPSSCCSSSSSSLSLVKRKLQRIEALFGDSDDIILDENDVGFDKKCSSRKKKSRKFRTLNQIYEDAKLVPTAY